MIKFNTRTKAAIAVLATASTLGLTACGTTYGPTTYGQAEAGVAAYTESGTVVGYRPVRFEQGELKGGTAAGAAVGAVGGAALGGDTEGRIAGGVLGAVAGALIGREVQKQAYSGTGFAYTVELDNRDLVTVAQGGQQPIPVGTRVFVETGANARVYPQTGGAGYRY
ncbi:MULTISPECIES: glycine zipper 2TM domain-containing protein [Euryhalocaulis]|uniref:glycine zipper 2TM domain-containing protein n=1 Tax=Euryhalocaulis TaxID=1712422 RepID=UPI00039FDD3A|nr:MULTISPECIES: glycine zipper 2TM domain-containing protein [Euryhalocaulis]MBA4802024.1 glycine zipper 2TM domain-containing protein [Euryhalocaulis sp.]